MGGKKFVEMDMFSIAELRFKEHILQKHKKEGAYCITFGQGWPGIHGHVLVAASLLVRTG